MSTNFGAGKSIASDSDMSDNTPAVGSVQGATMGHQLKPDHYSIAMQEGELDSTKKPPQKQRIKLRNLKKGHYVVTNPLASQSSTTVRELVCDGRLDELKALFESSALTLKESDGNQGTLLHTAAQSNQVAVMQYLIDSGVKLNAVDNDGNTALHIAVLNANIEAVDVLLQAGIDDIILNKEMDAALHIVVRNNHPNILSLFLDYGVEIVIPGYRKKTPLHVISENDSIECIKVLHNKLSTLERYKGKYCFRLCAKDEDQVTPLHLAARSGSHRVLDVLIARCKEHGYEIKTVLSFLDEENCTPLQAAVDGGYTEVVEVLLKHGASPVEAKGDHPPPLHMSCAQGRLSMVELMVKYGGPDIVHSVDQSMQTPLHHAALSLNCVEIITYLLRMGAHIDPENKRGRTPLHIAVTRGNFAAMQELLERGANPLHLDAQGYNIFHHAIFGNQKAMISHMLKLHCAKELMDPCQKSGKGQKQGSCPIMLAINEGLTDYVVAMLSIVQQCCLKWLEVETQNTILHVAAYHGNWRVLLALLDIQGSHVLLNKTNKHGGTPLHCAALKGNSRCAEILLNHGGMIHKCYKGHTPFLVACSKGHCECASILIKAHPFQKDWTDDDGNTALHLAAESGSPNCIALALSSGVEVTLNDNDDSFFDILINKLDMRSALAVIEHERWQECLDLHSPDHPHPIISLIATMPEVARAVYDRCCSKSSLPSDHKKYWECYKFKYIKLDSGVGQSVSTEKESEDEREPMLKHFSMGSIRSTKRSRVFSSEDANNPFEALKVMVKYNRSGLLTHPVVEAFIKSKWRDYGRILYTATIFIFFFQVLFLSFFIYFTPIFTSLNSVHVNETENGSNMSSDTLSLASFVTGGISLSFCIPNTMVLAFLVITKRLSMLNFVKNLWVWTLGISVVLTIVFVISAFVHGLNGIFWEVGAVAIFISWFHCMLQLELFDIFGIYVVMFLEVTRTVFIVLMMFFFYILAFGLSFYILLSTVDDLDDFSTLGNSFVTNFGFLFGEIDYSGLITKKTEGLLPYTELTLLFIIIVAILMAIIVANLLIGLAVGDIEKIRMNAIIRARAKQISFFTDMDRVLPKRLLKRYNRSNIKRHPNSPASAAKMIWRYTWRTIKGVDPESASSLEEATDAGRGAVGSSAELDQIKNRMDDIEHKQDKILELLQQLCKTEVRQQQLDTNDTATDEVEQ